MANVEAVSREKEMRDVLARASSFYQKWAKLGGQIDAFMKDFAGFRNDLVTAINHKESLDRLNKDAEIKLAKTEKEAQTRLSSMEQGHRAIIERVSKKELECDALKAELDKKELALARQREEIEIIRADLDRKIQAAEELSREVGRKSR